MQNPGGMAAPLAGGHPSGSPHPLLQASSGSRPLKRFGGPHDRSPWPPSGLPSSSSTGEADLLTFVLQPAFQGLQPLVRKECGPL